MTDPKAEALARLKWQERNSEANMALMSARDIFRDGVFDGYDARDEEAAALKAERERLRAALRRLIQLGHAKDCTESRTETCNCGQAEAVAALAAADRKDGEKT